MCSLCFSLPCLPNTVKNFWSFPSLQLRHLQLFLLSLLQVVLDSWCKVFKLIYFTIKENREAVKNKCSWKDVELSIRLKQLLVSKLTHINFYKDKHDFSDFFGNSDYLSYQKTGCESLIRLTQYCDLTLLASAWRFSSINWVSLTPLLLLQLNHLNDNPVLFLINKIVVKFPYPIPTCLHITIISFTTKWEAFVFETTQCEVLSVMLENIIYFNTITWCLIQFIQISFPQQILLVSSFSTLLRLSYINTVLFLSTRTAVLAIYPVYNHFTLSNIILLSYFAKSAAVIVLKGTLGNPGLTYWFDNHLHVTTCPDCQCQGKGIWSCI